MSDDRLPVQADDRGRRSSRVPMRRPEPAPVHAAEELSFTTNTAPREELWERLGPKIHQRVNAKLGTLVEWWAAAYDGRVSAVALGERALVVVNPTVNDRGEAAYRIESRVLDEASFRSVRISEAADRRPPGPSVRPGTGPSVQGGGLASPGVDPTRQGPRRGPGARHEPDEKLSTLLGLDMTGFLGHLPARAQRLLQDPFVGVGEGVDLKGDFHYVRFGRSQGIGGATLQVWCYLADSRFVTFAAGAGHSYRDASGADSWDLTCWRARCAPRTRSHG